MAYLENQDDEEQKKQEQQALQLSSGGGAAAPGAPAPSGAAPAATPAPAAAQNAGGTPGRYVNFERYFNANKGGAQQLGGQLAGSIEKAGTGVQGELAGKQQAFGAAVQAGSQSPLATVGKAPVDPLAPKTPGSKGAAAPSLSGQAPAPLPDTEEQLQKLAGQKYTGPGALSDDKPSWEGFVGKANAAASKATQGATSEGRQALLQDERKGTGYTQGQSRFDAGLVGAASGDRFSRLKERFGGLGQSAIAADAASQAQGNAARGAVDARAAGAQKQIETNAANRAAEHARQEQARMAEIEAKRAKERDFWRSDEGRKQYAADQATYKWQQKFLDTAPSEVLDELYKAKPYGAASYDLSHPGVHKWMAYLAKRYGEDVAKEWLNAARDDNGRAERNKAFNQHNGPQQNYTPSFVEQAAENAAASTATNFVNNAQDQANRR